MIGNLRFRVTFKEKVVTDDGSGGTTFTWADYYTCWASLNPMKASRKLIDNQEVMTNATEVYIRYNPDKPITKDLKMFFGEDEYTITSIVEVKQRERFYQIIAMSSNG